MIRRIAVCFDSRLLVSRFALCFECRVDFSRFLVKSRIGRLDCRFVVGFVVRIGGRL